eukprot:scaffold5951_cov162-Chaetoceros_neogracile.AAC.1
MASNISPFAHGPLSDAINAKSGDIIQSPSNLISKSDCDKAYGHLSDPVCSILEELTQKKDENNNPLTFEWTFNRDDYRQAFSKSRTKTAPGYSGMTMSLWKAIVEDD